VKREYSKVRAQVFSLRPAGRHAPPDGSDRISVWGRCNEEATQRNQGAVEKGENRGRETLKIGGYIGGIRYHDTG